jgi:hypothetical protein
MTQTLFDQQSPGFPNAAYRLDFLPRRGGHVEVHAQAYRSACILICHNGREVDVRSLPNDTYRAEFQVQRGDVVEMWCGAACCRAEYQVRPVVVENALHAEIYHNGVNLKDVLRELAELGE